MYLPLLTKQRNFYHYSYSTIEDVGTVSPISSTGIVILWVPNIVAKVVILIQKRVLRSASFPLSSSLRSWTKRHPLLLIPLSNLFKKTLNWKGTLHKYCWRVYLLFIIIIISIQSDDFNLKIPIHAIILPAHETTDHD